MGDLGYADNLAGVHARANRRRCSALSVWNGRRRSEGASAEIKMSAPKTIPKDAQVTMLKHRFQVLFVTKSQFDLFPARCFL